MMGISVFYLTAFMLVLAATCFSMPVNDSTQYTIDQVISKARAPSTAGGPLAALKDSNTVLVELDILYPIEEYLQMKKETREAEGRFKRKARIPESKYRWTDRTIPYEISHDFDVDKEYAILTAFKEYHKYTCLKFVPALPSHKNRLQFENKDGCQSFVGMKGGNQSIFLSEFCFRKYGVIIHEIGHAIGFFHEHMRPDRDNFVKIQMENVFPGQDYNFEKESDKHCDTYGVCYDYLSVMHYGQYTWSATGKPTIIARDKEYQDLMGNRDGLSFRDIKIANLMYHCAEHNKCQKIKCPYDGFQGKDCKCWCDSGDRKKPVRHC